MTLKYSSKRPHVIPGRSSGRSFRRKFALQLTLIGGVLFLTGCNAGLSTTNNSDVSGIALSKTPPAEQQVAGASRLVEASRPMDANTMFQILAAEMMVQRGQPAQAFDVIYELALKTQDVGLAERAFELSMSTYDTQKIEAATLLWRDVSPQAAIAWRASFLISLRQNELKQALEQWHRYHSFSKDGLEGDFLLTAQRVSTTAKPEIGIAFMQALSKDFPDTWASFFALGYVAQAHGELEVSLKALEKAQTLQTPESMAQINRLLAKLYLQLPPPEKGLESLAPYLQDNPEDWVVQERVARLEVQASRYDAAEARYQNILKTVPEAYTARLSLALLQIERKAYLKAEVNLNQVLQVDGYGNVANYYLGLLSQEQQEYGKALRYFSKVSSNNYYIDAQLHRAEIYFSMSELAKAIQVLDLIKTEQPQDKVKVYRAKGVFYSYDNQYPQAVEEFERVLQIDPGHIEVLMAQALMLYKLEAFERYERNLKRVIEQDPKEVDALNALGYFYVEKNSNLEVAEDLLNQAHALAPDSYYVLDSLGWLYFQKQEYARAEEFLKKALAIKVDDEVLIHLISTYWEMGEHSKAKAVWRKYHAGFLQNERLQLLIEELEAP